MGRTRASSYDSKAGHIRQMAAMLFATNGFSRTSMAELATACGVSKALLYHYHDSKEALLYDILLKHLEYLVVVLRINTADYASPRDELRTLIFNLLSAYKSADNTHKLLLHDLNALPPEKCATLNRLERQIMRVFHDALTRNAEHLGISKPVGTPLAMMLLGTLNWTNTWFQEDGNLTLGAYSDLVCDTAVAGLTAI